MKHKRHIRSYVLRSTKLTKNKSDKLEDLKQYYCLEYKDNEIDLHTLFEVRQPVICDIGFGSGKSLLEQALRNPNFNFLGIEVYTPGILNVLSQVDQCGIKNIKIIQHDAVEVLANMIPASSLCKVQLLYPDPWPKKRHHKRRIISQNFLSCIGKTLGQEGILQVVTDWDNYAENIISDISSNNAFKAIDINGSYQEKISWPDIFTTSYALKAKEKGHNISNLVYQLSSN
ncbi:MAG: tRNA (guanosine(46)-N7)-methyltransferase TrmB [Pseudomonadota bacterium]|nr:tRNA (guanosine(46)-N7)-methyltransferase TrmB [Pseudomonadota bacterium]